LVHGWDLILENFTIKSCDENSNDFEVKFCMLQPQHPQSKTVFPLVDCFKAVVAEQNPYYQFVLLPSQK